MHSKKGCQIGRKYEDQQNSEDDDCIARKWCQVFAAGHVGHKHEDQQNNEDDDCIARHLCLASASHDADSDASLLIHS